MHYTFNVLRYLPTYLASETEMATGFTFSEIIALKQNSKILTRDQIQWTIDSILSKNAHDAQIGAFLMAVYLKGNYF